jgi:hypothetical protein
MTSRPPPEDGALSPLAIGAALTAGATAWMLIQWLSLVLR